MPRTDDRLLQEIHSERQELTLAVASLREELQRARRRAPAIAAGAVAAVATLKLVARSLRRRRR
jgi:hypothetical protein